MKTTVIAAAITIGLFAVNGAATASEALAKSSGCLGCHAIDAKKVGPAFKETAAKYKGKADAGETLNAKLAAAKGHPKVKASDDELKTLIKWVLAM